MGAIEINRIINSPFFSSEIIHSFICGYQKDLHYSVLMFVLPIIYNGDCRKKFNSANNRSDIYSLFASNKKYYNNQVSLSSKIDLYSIFQNNTDLINLTQKAIIILSTKDEIAIDSKGFIINKNIDKSFERIKNKDIKEYIRSSYYLGVILSKNNINEFLELMKGV